MLHLYTGKPRNFKVHDAVQDLCQDRHGPIWIATEGGLTRYRPYRTPPAIRLTDVITDRRYGPIQELQLPASQEFAIFEFQGRSLTTRPDGMAYVYRLNGRDPDWQLTYARRVEYQDLPLGTYTFQVKAVDRDLNYSEPAEVHLTVVPDPRDQRIDALEQRVRERTAKLEAANAQLADSNQQLTAANAQIQQQTERKSDFLARMSHDLRTPMNAIIGYTRILLRQAKDILNERQYRNLDNIQISANNLLSLINDILDLSKIEAGRIDIKPEAVDLKQLATECIASVESLVKPGVQLERQLEDVNPVNTDADRIQRVVMNLLSNALKFTEKGSITLSLKSVEDEMELSVADTGSGIPAEDLPYIFDEFRQVEGQKGTQQEGTGLGLSIAKKSVELLGGKIGVESEVGKGTTFTLRIPDYKD
jgi:signal transduction histidine kinase